MDDERLGMYERLPKVELHLHLEGAIPLPALWDLVCKYAPAGDNLEIADLAALEQRFAYRDFPHFLEIWNWKNQYLRELDDFTMIAEAVARDLARQNIRYAEAFTSPSDFAYHGLDAREVVVALRRGLDRVPGVEVRLIVDLVRNRGPEHGMQQLDRAFEVRDQGVIGIGIGGAEHGFPPAPFAGIYARARELGFHTTAHAGEAAGPESVWGAIKALGAERIGHGTRAGEDPALIDYLSQARIPLEMCPLSNVRTGVVPELAAHPIRRYFEQGALVTLNTDDPKMFGNTLAEEAVLLERVLGFTPEEVRQVLLNGIRASWLPEERKAEMLQAFQEDPAWRAMQVSGVTA